MTGRNLAGLIEYGPWTQYSLKRLQAQFTADGVKTDPTSAEFLIRHWNEAEETLHPWSYPGNITPDLPEGAGSGLLKRKSTGLYYVDFTFDKPGRWYWMFRGSGSLIQTIEGTALIHHSRTIPGSA